jgi:hypothetical protein
MTVAIRIRNYSELTEALAARRRSLGLRQLDLDEKSGLMSGYSGKIEAGIRKLGYISLPNLLAALDADLLLCPRSGAAPVEARTGSAGTVQHLNRQPNGEPTS